MKNHIAVLKDARITAIIIENRGHRLGNNQEAQYWYELDKKLALAIERLQEQEEK